MKKGKGFTLIELMIVVAIIGILAAIAIPRFAQLIDKAREAGARGNLGAIRSAIAVYYGDNKGQWPMALNAQSFRANNENFPAFIGRYMARLPKATLQRSNPHNNLSTIEYTAWDPTTAGKSHLTSGDLTDAGGWIYSSTCGECRINCTHHDTLLNTDRNSTLRYSNYGYEEP